VAVFEGYEPAQTRPYGYGNNYLRIINRSNERRKAGLRRLEILEVETDFPSPGGFRRL
jgi:hypothetical protein